MVGGASCCRCRWSRRWPPALELPLCSALESPPLVPALASPPESPLEPPRVSASELLIPALASPLELLLELPRVSASELLLVFAL